jgi:hypothetical protein
MKWHTWEAAVAHAAPAIPYPRNVHRKMSPQRLIRLAIANTLRGPHESCMPRLCKYPQKSAHFHVPIGTEWWKKGIYNEEWLQMSVYLALWATMPTSTAGHAKALIWRSKHQWHPQYNLQKTKGSKETKRSLNWSSSLCMSTGTEQLPTHHPISNGWSLLKAKQNWELCWLQ